MRIKRSLQRGPKYPKKGKNLPPKAKNRKTKTRRTEGNRATTASRHHGQAVVSPTSLPPVARFPSRASSTSDGSASVLPLYCNVSGHSEDPIHSIAIIFSNSFRVVFRERKKERRRTVRILHRAWRSKDGSTHLDELFFFFSTLFSI